MSDFVENVNATRNTQVKRNIQREIVPASICGHKNLCDFSKQPAAEFTECSHPGLATRNEV